MLALNNKIYSTRGSGALQFAELVPKFSNVKCVAPSVIEENYALMNREDSENKVIYFAEPAVLLKRLYRQLKNDNKVTGSFKSFYENDNQVSSFFRVLKDIDLSLFSAFIDDQRLLKSMLIYEEFTEGFGKLPYGQLFSRKLNTFVEENERRHIKQIYESEYKTYQRLLRAFEEQWLKFSEPRKIETQNNKHISVHLGPPKTGTSALQRWLCDNTKLLAQHNILYPNHTSDSNGISSGNFSFFLSSDSEGKVYFDQTKAATNISALDKSPYSSLLVSSELFYYFLPWLFTSLPGAHYIFYIRHPIALFESGYHQQVKRHGRTEEFQIPNHISFNNLKVIANIADEFNIEVDYRYFDTVTKTSGSIYHDFASCFSSFIPPLTSESKVNTKYSPGALALMSEANKFAPSYLKSELDLWLQRVSESVDDFSLIPTDRLTALNEKLLVEAESLTNRYPSISFDKMTTLIQAYQPAKYFSKDEIESDLYQLLNRLRSENPLLAYTLLAHAKKHKQPDSSHLLLTGMKLSGRPTWYYLLAEQTFKFSLSLKKLREKLKRVLS